MAELNQRAQDCGYFDFLDNALTYPPTGPIPSAPNSSLPGCAVWDDAIVAAAYVNPCFNFYHITDFCPYLSDELGMWPLIMICHPCRHQAHPLCFKKKSAAVALLLSRCM